ncbi:hypothetical protein F9K33_01890 [bacterium]|nr:MAG: hypothetical protein F9K33_01890 [bacterium]
MEKQGKYNQTHFALILIVLMIIISCDKNDNEIKGITRTDANGNILSVDEDDWVMRSSAPSENEPSISPPYPNPVTGPLQFKFGLADTMRVTFQIRNSKKIVRTLLESELRQSGFHTILWDLKGDDGETVPDGLYRCIITFLYGDTTFNTYGDIEVDVM